MKKIDLGQTIGILANIGVIAGIVFLALELEQNNDLLQSEAEYRLFENRSRIAREVYRDAELAELMDKLQRNEELSTVERIRAENLYESMYQNWRWEYRQWEQGRIETLPLEGWRNLPRTNSLAKEVLEMWIESNRKLGGSDARHAEFLEENVLSE